MSLNARLRDFVNRLLAPARLTLARPHELAATQPDRWTMEAALGRAATIGLAPATIIDVGAAAGEWAQAARSTFPKAALLLIEPLAERQARLTEFSRRCPGTHLVAAVAGATTGHIELNVSDDLDGSGVYGPHGGGALRHVPQVTIDDAVARHGLRGPFLLKLDTHGYELPIFAGATATLAQTELLIVETYGFKPAPTAVRFWELCVWLEQRGFRPADIAGLMARKRDGMFWQADLFFLRSNHPVFASDSFQ